MALFFKEPIVAKKKTPTPAETVTEVTTSNETVVTPVQEKAKASKVATPALAEFNPKRLRSIGNGLWRYVEDVELVNRETFHTKGAKDFGIKENDIVFVVSNGKVISLGV